MEFMILQKSCGAITQIEFYKLYKLENFKL